MKKADPREVTSRLKKAFPDVAVPLHYSTPLQLLVATILSAQCTDERVNKVTESLFAKYRSAEDFAGADAAVLEQDIRSTGFYRNKAKNIIGAARMIRNEFGGKVPDSMQEILRLPGVARKTANVVLGNAYGKQEGIVVDTHVLRVTGRLGLTRNEDPVKVEEDLMKDIPRSEWREFALRIQALGKQVCRARNPDHAVCVLRDICPSSKI
jgi:endonuclease-3